MKITTYEQLTKDEQFVYDFMFECVNDDDFYTNEGLLSSDMLVMFVNDNYPEYAQLRIEAIAKFVADWVNR